MMIRVEMNDVMPVAFSVADLDPDIPRQARGLLDAYKPDTENNPNIYRTGTDTFMFRVQNASEIRDRLNRLIRNAMAIGDLKRRALQSIGDVPDASWLTLQTFECGDPARNVIQFDRETMTVPENSILENA
jgi:hypothetical protein